MGLYVPFILPGLLAYVAFAVGIVHRHWWVENQPALSLLRQLIPLLAAGMAATAVLVVWVLTRWATIVALLSTVYPGQRSEPTGILLQREPHLTGLGGFPWNQVLTRTSAPTLIGPNSSEGSGVLLLALFLVPGIVWLLVISRRRTHRLDGLVVAMIVFLTIVAAYLFVPGWDALAHLLLLDRVPPERFRIVFLVLLPVFAALTVEKVDALRSRWSWGAGALSGVIALSSFVALALSLDAHDPIVLQLAPRWPIIIIAIVAAIMLFFVRTLVPLAVLLTLSTVLVTGWGVNPIYHGIFDLSATPAGRTVERIDRADPGTWISVGSGETRATVVETGVKSLSGVQSYPSTRMWTQIDPGKKYEVAWNRLGQIVWSFAPGPMTITNPKPDTIQITVDPCSDFAVEHIDYVLADGPMPPSPCMSPIESSHIGNSTMTVYRIDGP
jgi:hypothetical protein